MIHPPRATTARVVICPPCVVGHCVHCWGAIESASATAACACTHAGAVSPDPTSPPNLSVVRPDAAPEADITALRHELDICVEEIARLGRDLAEARRDLEEKDRELVLAREATIALQDALDERGQAPTTLEELEAMFPAASVETSTGEVVIYTGLSVVDDHASGRLVPMADVPRPAGDAPPLGGGLL